MEELGFQAVCPPRSFVHFFIQTDTVTIVSHECLQDFEKTDREYPLASTDDLIRFWKSKVARW